MVSSYLSRTGCHTGLGRIGVGHNKTEVSEFNELILKYTKENILKINIYIKEPFARKYLMVEYASMYELFCPSNIIKNYSNSASHGSVTSEV